MKNNFQSKAVPRGTRTIWRYLSALLILFTFAIGNVWAAETVLFSSFANTTASNYFKSYTVDGKTVTVAASSTTISSSSGDYFCTMMQGTPSNNNDKYVELTVTGATIKTVSVLITGNGSDKTCQPALLGWEGAIASNTTADYVLVPASQVISNKGVANAKWHQFDVHGNDLTRVRIYRAVKSVSVAGAAAQQYGNGQSLQFYGIRVELEGLTPVCPSGLSISSKNDQVAFTEGDPIELTAALTAGNGDITYQWYKGSVAPANAITGATNAKYQVASCTTADAGDYYCVASKTSCDDAVNASAFAITVAADTKCFNMPAITSTPANIGAITVSGGTLADVGDGKTLKMQSTGIGFGNGNAARLQVTLTSASIVEGTKITVYYNNASSDGSGIGLYNENYEHQVINETGVTGSGNFSHTFTAEEAANYADVFLIDRNNTGKGIIVGSITVEDCGPAIVKHTVTLNYNDGETPAGSLTVVDGNAAVKPADPTRGKYTFLGWFVGDTDDEYDWLTAVTGDITLKAHWQDPWTITFDAGEGSAVADITVKHNTLAEKPADPTWAGHDFNGWTEGGSPFDWTAAITANHSLVAVWITPVAKYDVQYYDGETLLGTEEQVRADQHPTAAGITTERTLYSFVGWYLSSTLEGDPVALNTVTPVEGLKLYGKWNKVYASNADFEAYIIANPDEKDNEDKAEAYVKSLNYALSTKTNTTFDANTGSNNGAYAGFKIKNAGTTLSWNVVADKVVELKAGVMVANGSLAINSGTPATIDGGSTGSGDNFKIHYFYSATEALYEFTTSNGSAEVIKAITMRDPYTVSFEAHGDADPSALPGQPSVTLPAATNGTASLLGWFDAETGGNKIGDAGDSYTPTANITLHAQWEAVSTDARLASITFSSDAGTLSPAFNPEVVNYTYTMPYPTAAVPTITGATSVSAKAKTPVIDAQAANWGDVAHIHGVAESDDTKDYYITMKIAPKDGVSIIKVATTGGTNKTVTGLYAGDGDVNLSSNTKMDNGKYIGFTLDGTTLQAGDRINVHTTEAANTGGSHIIFYDNMTDKNELYETGEIGGTGDNIFVINAAMIGATTAYVYRSNADNPHKWNGYVDYIEVTRAMNPVLTAIQFNSTDVEVTSTTVATLLPQGTNLGTMTVTPTIYWNGAGTAEVTSNAGAWAWGANTYRVTDKDGDYTEYTITLTEDELKHTVSFNTHGGSTIDPVQVVDGQKLAAAPADPTKEDYIFQGWAETADGAIVDVTTFTISADKEFHAVWVADGAIKLLDGSTVNHTNFITAVTADETVEFQGNTVNYAKFSGTCSGVNSVKDLTRVIAYNATTNKTKIRISAHNNSTSARNILVKGLVEGASAAVDLANIALGNKEDKISDWIEFDNAANRTIYIMVSSSAGDVYFTQVKVVESGETLMKQAGEIGYSLNLNKGRAFGKADDDVVFEGLNIELIGDYTALNSGNLKMNSSSISFAVAAPVTLNVTTANSKTYYVANSASGTDNETAFAGVSEFNLTAGTWFINAGDADVQLTNISFTAPKCEKPVIATIADVDLCEGDAFTALVASASVSDGGTLHYAWFKEAGATDEPVGTDAASFTPDADGEYYVIVTNQKEDFADNSETSNAVTVQHLAGTIITTAPVSVRKDAGESATLSVVAAGKNLAYEWFTCNADGTGAEPVDPAATEASLEVIVPDGEQYYKVVVTGDCGTVEAIAKVEKWVELQQQDVTETTFWDFSKTGVSGNVTIPVTEEEPVKLLANIPGVNNNELFRSDNIVAGSGKLTTGYIQTQKLSFHATVPGYITVSFSNTGNKENYRYLVVNGVETSAGSKNGTAISYSCAVPAGDVELTVTEADGGKMFNFRSLKFEKMDYYRETRQGYYGTICLEHGGKVYGAALYEVAYFDGADKIFFDEIVDGTMVPGMPYIFLPEGDGKALAVAYSEEAPAADALSKNGLYGSYEKAELDPDDGNYILLNNQYVFVNTTNVFVGANRAYIRLEDIGTTPFAPAPGRRRISMGVSGESQAQGFENLDASEKPMKVMIDGQMYILRGEKVFDATGRLVK